jgi:hypothetical protein
LGRIIPWKLEHTSTFGNKRTVNGNCIVIFGIQINRI